MFDEVGIRSPSAVSIQQVSNEPPNGPRVNLMKRKTYDRSIDEFFHKKRYLCWTMVTRYVQGMQRNKNKSIMRLKMQSPARYNKGICMFTFTRDNYSGFKNPRILLFSHSNIVFCQFNCLFILSTFIINNPLVNKIVNLYFWFQIIIILRENAVTEFNIHYI